MDSHDRRSRQSNVPTFTGASAAGNAGAALLQHNTAVQATGQYPNVSGPGDRFQVRGGAGHIPAAASAGRSSSNMPSYQYQTNPAGAYGELSTGQTMQAASLQYPAGAGGDYGTSQDASQRVQQQPSQHQSPHTSQQPHQHQSPQQQHQSQQQYHNLYGQQASPSSPYDPVQQYPPRQSAAIEVLTNQFAGVPQTYYVPGEGGPTSAPNAGMAAQGVQQQYNPMAYNATQSPVGRESLTSSYGTGIADSSQAAVGTQQGYSQQAGYASQTADLDNAFAQYEDALRRTFEAIRESNLSEAGATIVSLSEWLLGNAESLGLVRDDESAHGTRLKLWSEFNTCWIALLQRQRDLTAEMLESNQRLGQPRSVLEYEQMENMGKELIRLCDNMEKHGLVDYQMGVWEEDIIDLLTQCLEMLDEQGTGGAVEMAQSTSRRR